MISEGKLVSLLVSSLILGNVYPAQSQPSVKSLPRIAFISPSGAPGSVSPLFEALRQGLSDLGYVDNKNITIVHRFAEGRLDRMPALINELVQDKVDVIVAVNNALIRAAKQATKTVPIVMVTSVDPVDAGYVESFARPGGNITGLANLGRDLSAKRVQLLTEVLPKLSRLAVLWDSKGPGPRIAFKEYEAAARAFKLDLRSLEVEGPIPELLSAFQAAKTAHVDALVVIGNPLMVQHSKEIFELAADYRLASMTEENRYVDAGGLISYGANLADLVRRAGGYVVEILKGAKPSDLQIKLPEKFEIFVNLKTAKRIGVVMPQQVLVQADKVVR